MEEARYWMWTRHKPSVAAAVPSAVEDLSWEEQAFAEDAAGGLGGGCTWPPRSYSCNFCRREFRSAQALGGHMNVHRRDRARLKQSPITDDDHPPPLPPQPPLEGILQQDHFNYTSACAMGFPNYTLVGNPNPSLDPMTTMNNNLSSPSSTISAAAPLASELNFFPSKSQNSSAESRIEEGSRKKTDLSVSLNLVVTRDEEEMKMVATGCKRRRTATDHQLESSSLPFFLKRRVVVDRDELDLELRLGDPPKVK